MRQTNNRDIAIKHPITLEMIFILFQNKRQKSQKTAKAAIK